VFCIYFWPELLIQRGTHIAFAVIQTITLMGYLIYVVRFYAKIAPIVLRANQEESTE
jgi:hypothetical protein